MTLSIYRFHQNNSGGYITDDVVIENPKQGFMVDYDVYIHATSEDEANRIAESCGVYFDGVEKGKDCDCCGDRWTRTVYPEDPDVLDDLVEELLDRRGFDKD